MINLKQLHFLFYVHSIIQRYNNKMKFLTHRLLYNLLFLTFSYKNGRSRLTRRAILFSLLPGGFLNQRCLAVQVSLIRSLRTNFSFLWW